MTSVTDPEVDVAALRAGDQAAFTARAERHRHELQVHCYRTVGSFPDAQDLLDLAAPIETEPEPTTVTTVTKETIELAFGDDVLSGGLTGDFLVRPVGVNRQGAAAFWVRRDGDSAYRAYGLGVLAVADGRIVELWASDPIEEESCRYTRCSLAFSSLTWPRRRRGMPVRSVGPTTAHRCPNWSSGSCSSRAGSRWCTTRSGPSTRPSPWWWAVWTIRWRR